MKSDFTRISFDPTQQYTAVLFQQGRAQLDADFNEASAIHAHFYESLAASLTGTEGAIWLEPSKLIPVVPRHLPGFRIIHRRMLSQLHGSLAERAAELKEGEKDGMDANAKYLEAFEGAAWWISPGHYYAGGLRCENDAWVPLSAQPFLPDATAQVPEEEDPDSAHSLWLLYLDAWERPLSWLDVPRLTDVALGSAVDTAMRAQSIWQVRSFRLSTTDFAEAEGDANKASRIPMLEAFQGLPWMRPQPRLRVRIKPGAASNDPCRPAFATAWQGQENQLYRVEIHDGSLAESDSAPPVSFKWSRENGSVAARVAEVKGTSILIAPSQLKAGGFRPGDRVEVLKEDADFTGLPGAMLIVAKVHGHTLIFEGPEGGKGIAKGDKLRRWDQKPCGGTVLAVEHQWVELEQGIEVLFEPAAALADHTVDDPKCPHNFECYGATQFRTGDYWVFTARTATAAVDWPLEPAEEIHIPVALSAQLAGISLAKSLQVAQVPIRADGKPPGPAENARPAALPPHGVQHRYALLASVLYDGKDRMSMEDLRRILNLCEWTPEYRKPAVPAVDGAPADKPADKPAEVVIVAKPSREIFEKIAAAETNTKIMTETAAKWEAVERGEMEKMNAAFTDALKPAPETTKAKSSRKAKGGSA